MPFYAAGDCPDNGKNGKLAAISPCRACPAHPISPVPPKFIQAPEKFDIGRKIQENGQTGYEQSQQ